MGFALAQVPIWAFFEMLKSSDSGIVQVILKFAIDGSMVTLGKSYCGSWNSIDFFTQMNILRGLFDIL